MKTGTIETVQGNGGYDSDYGYIFTFEYKMDNGDFGVAGHKSDTPKYNPGDQVHYELKDTAHGNKIKFVNPEHQETPAPSKPQAAPQSANQREVGIALKYATMVKCAYVSHGMDYSREQLETETRMMMDIMANLK